MSAWVGTDYLLADGDIPDPPPFNPVLGRPDKALVPRWPEPDSPRIHRHFRGYWDSDRSPLFCRVFGRLCWGHTEPILQGGHDHRRYFALDLDVAQEHRLQGEILQASPGEPAVKLTIEWLPFVPLVNGPATGYTWDFIVPGNPSVSKVRYARFHAWNGPLDVTPTWHNIAPIAAWDLGLSVAYRWAWIDWVAMATNYSGLPPYVPRDEGDEMYQVFAPAAATNIVAGTPTAINFAQPTVEEGGTWWSAGQPNRLTVPTGISKVRLLGQISGPLTTAFVSVLFRKNGVGIVPEQRHSDRLASSAQNNVIQVSSWKMAVVAGDYFELLHSNSLTSGAIFPLSSWIEVVAS